MKVRKIQCCSNCGKERPRNQYCIGCNGVGRKKKIQFTFTIGWRRPEWGEYEDVPLGERELIKVPVEPPFEER